MQKDQYFTMKLWQGYGKYKFMLKNLKFYLCLSELTTPHQSASAKLLK